MEPTIVAAGLTAAASMFQQMQAQQQAKAAQERQERLDRLKFARERQVQAERDHLSTIARMGDSEKSALSNMIAALARTAG